MLKSFRRIAASIPLTEIVAALDAELLSGTAEDTPAMITDVAPVDQAGATELAFVAGRVYINMLPDSNAGVVLVATSFDKETRMPVLRVANPRAAFAKVIEMFYAPCVSKPGVHATAIVPDSASVDPSARVDAYTVLGEHVSVGPGAHLHPHVTVYDDASIGAGTVIHSGAVVREGVRIGKNVTLHNGAVVGADGFGYEPTASRAWARVMQVGTVVVGDDAEIHAGACVDRAAVGTTSVGRGTKIDNLVQVGHGSRIGEDSMLCGQVGLAGSTVLGDRVVLGGQVGSAGHVTVNDDVQVGAQSGIMRDLESGTSYIGTPAMEQRHARSVYLQFSKLPEMHKRIKALERIEEARKQDE